MPPRGDWKRGRETAHSRTYARTHARKVEAEFHIRSPLSKPGCRHIQAMFAMADTYIEPELRVRNVAFCRAFSTHTRAPSCRFRGKWRSRKSGVRNRAQTEVRERGHGFSSFPIGTHTFSTSRGRIRRTCNSHTRPFQPRWLGWWSAQIARRKTCVLV